MNSSIVFNMFFLRRIIFSVSFLFIATKSFAEYKPLRFYYDSGCNLSSFRNVSIIDHRGTGDNFGFILSEVYNNLLFDGNFNDSLSKFFMQLNSPVPINKDLVVMVEELCISEISNHGNETGRIKVDLRIFAGEKEGTFTELKGLDSLIFISGKDFKIRMYKTLSMQICNLSASLKDLTPVNSSLQNEYSFTELINLDSIEKSLIPIYTAAKINSGIFTTYEQFKLNAPDPVAVFIDTLSARNAKVYKLVNNVQEKLALDYKTVYAIYDGNILLKATGTGFYKMNKLDNDYVYEGNTSYMVPFKKENTIRGNYSAPNLATDQYFYYWATPYRRDLKSSNSYIETPQSYRFKIAYDKGNSVLLGVAE